MKLGMAGLVATTMLLTTAPAWAGHPQERKGFWIGFGFGYGSASIGADCEDCDFDDREESFTGYLKMGGTISPRVLIGGEFNGWFKEEDDTTLTIGAFTGTVTFYPWVESGFFLKGGLGFSYFGTDTEFSGGTFTTSKSGWAVLAGIGYDLRVGRNLSLTPSVNWHYGKPGDVDFDGDVLPGLKQNVVSFELGLTFH